MVYEKMPHLKVWYPNNDKKLTIGMIWDENPNVRADMIPEPYFKSNAFLFMPMINEISVDLVKNVDGIIMCISVIKSRSLPSRWILL